MSATLERSESCGRNCSSGVRAGTRGLSLSLSEDGVESEMEEREGGGVGNGDLHFSSWHNLIREVVGYYDRSKFKGGNDNLVEYC